MMLGLMLLSLMQDSEREIINRREEARGAFLATPQGIYRHYCAHCHGDDGKGDGRLWTTELAPKPADLSTSRLDETALAAFISKGSAASGRSSFCPPWERTIPTADTHRLARFLVSMRAGKSPAPVAPASAADQPREPFPWLPAGVIVAEIILVASMLLRRKKEVPDVVPQDPPVRG